MLCSVVGYKQFIPRVYKEGVGDDKFICICTSVHLCICEEDISMLLQDTESKFTRVPA